MSFRLAAYGICVDDDQVLLVQAAGPDGDWVWTLPGGGVMPGEDPFAAVTREVWEETGLTATVVSLLGVDSRVIPAAEAWAGSRHQNVGIYYEVDAVAGQLRAEANGDTGRPRWTAIASVPDLIRSSLVDVGLRLHQERPASGHVPDVAVQGLLRH